MQNPRKWFEHKTRLAEKGLIHPVFTSLHLVRFDLDAAHNFEPLLVARHAQRMGELVDRCLALRKDIRELEVLEVKAATDYDLFSNTSALDEQMDILRLQLKSKGDDQTGFTNAASSFATTSTLELGLIQIAKGRAAALGDDLTESGQIKDLITAKWRDLHLYQDAYHARYTEPGNAHNYGERATLLLAVLTVLMQEALERAAALTAGVFQVYAATLKPPTSVTLETLDDFSIWALQTIQALSRTAEQEVVSEIVVPLVQPWLPSLVPLIRNDDFDSAVADSEPGQPISLSFTFPANGLLDSRTRLKGIGISFGNEFAIVPGSGIDRNQTADTFTRLTVTLFTPAQVAADGTSYNRAPLLIGNAGLHGTGVGASTVEGTTIENLSPFGTWKIDVHSLIVWKDASQQSVSSMGYSDSIKDLKLTLRFYVPGVFR